MHTEYLDYTDQQRVYEAFIAYDESTKTKRPCVIICHAWQGQSDLERKRAVQIAQLGYIAFALDVYGKGIRGKPMTDNSALMQPLMADRSMLLRRLKAAIKAAKEYPLVDINHIGVIGYCFGGLCALDMARSADPSIKCAVSFHGVFERPNLGKQAPITAKVLILHGYNDPMATPTQMLEIAEELNQAQADWQIHLYGQTMHAFTAPLANLPEKGLLYNQAADERSWLTMKNFLSEVLL